MNISSDQVACLKRDFLWLEKRPKFYDMTIYLTASFITWRTGHDKRLWAHFSISRATYLRSMWPKKGLNWLILVCRLKVALTLMEVNCNKNEGTFRKNGYFYLSRFWLTREKNHVEVSEDFWRFLKKFLWSHENSTFLCFHNFLVVDTQLYKSLCLSVHPSVRRSIHPSVRPSVR